MAINTLDGMLAGMQKPRYFHKLGTTLTAGKPYSYWASTGIPGPGSYNATLNGVVLDSSSALVDGQIPHFDPVSGSTYLARLQFGNVQQFGQFILADRLWHNGGYTITSATAQNSTTPTWPARDVNGSTNGDGVFLAVEVSATVGAATPTITVSYTNSAGTSGRTGTNFPLTTSAAVAGSTFFINLQAGDTGVRSVQSLTLSVSYVSGTINMVAYRPIAFVEIGGVGFGASEDIVTSGLPLIYNGSVPYLMFVPSTTTRPIANGTYVEAQG